MRPSAVVRGPRGGDAQRPEAAGCVASLSSSGHAQLEGHVSDFLFSATMMRTGVQTAKELYQFLKNRGREEAYPLFTFVVRPLFSLFFLLSPSPDTWCHHSTASRTRASSPTRSRRTSERPLLVRHHRPPRSRSSLVLGSSASFVLAYHRSLSSLSLPRPLPGSTRSPSQQRPLELEKDRSAPLSPRAAPSYERRPVERCARSSSSAVQERASMRSKRFTWLEPRAQRSPASPGISPSSRWSPSGAERCCKLV